ncbi:MAG: hypothetical protein Q8R91_06005 [Candidatus Omnitrophota bacterium]|nr:hypothetical protein [Candidatus Omnitrophota bacterium]
MLRILQILGAVVFAVFFATQVLWPMWQGTLLFPIFRPKQRRLEKELRTVREETVTADLEKAVEQSKDELAARRKPGKQTQA